jgi:DNA-binding MarR family transcriptional regulator
MTNRTRLDQISEGALLLFPLLKRLVQGDPDDPARVPFRNHSYHVLKMLERRGPLPMSVVGKQLAIAKQNMTTLIDKLMREGLVERRQDAADRRVVQIAITPRGGRFLTASRTALKRIIRKNLSELCEEDVRSLDAALQMIRAVVAKLEPGDSTPRRERVTTPCGELRSP